MTERQMLLVFALKFAQMNFWSMHTTNEPDPRVDTVFYTYERKDVEAMIALLKQEGLIEMATDIAMKVWAVFLWSGCSKAWTEEMEVQ